MSDVKRPSRLTPRYLDDHFETCGWPDRGDGPMWEPVLSVVVIVVVAFPRKGSVSSVDTYPDPDPDLGSRTRTARINWQRRVGE